MKYFLIFLTGFLIIYLLCFLKKTHLNISFMSRDFTTSLKGFSILTVLAAHTGARLGVGSIQFVAGVGVALFLICSGYGLELSYQNNGLQNFWKKRFLKVCVPFWIVEFVGLVAIRQFNIPRYLLDVTFLRPATGYGWFMQYIVVCYFLFFCVKIICQKTGTRDIYLLAGAFAIWFVLESVFFAKPDMPFLRARQMPSFLLGVAIAKIRYRLEQELSRKKLTILAAIGGIVGVILLVITQLSAVKAMPYLISNGLALVSMLSLSLAVIAITTLFMPLLHNSFLVWLGTISFELYLVHGFTLELVSYSFTWIFAFIIVTFVLAVGIHRLLLKIWRRDCGKESLDN